MPDQESLAPLPFPEKGLDASRPAAEQPPLTTARARNCRFCEAAGKRCRGGARPGLSRYVDARVNGARAVQDLNVVVGTSYRGGTGAGGGGGGGPGFGPGAEGPWAVPPQLALAHASPNTGPKVGLIDAFGIGFTLANIQSGTNHLRALFEGYGYEFVQAPTDYGGTVSFAGFEDLTEFSLVIMSFGNTCGEFLTDANLYADATFNARLKSWVEGGGRLFTHGEFGYPPSPVRSCLKDRAAFNGWLAGLGTTMRMGSGRFNAEGIAGDDYPPPAVWVNAAPPLAQHWYCDSAGIVHPNSGRALYDSSTPANPFFAILPTFPADPGVDPDAPYSRCVMAVEQLGNGYLVLGGDGDVFPGATDVVGPTSDAELGDANDEFWVNLLLAPDPWLRSLTV